MKNYKLSLWLLITSLIFFGFKNNPEEVKVSIAGTSVIKSEKGQRPVKVMIYLSQATKEPVTVKYSTEDSTAKAGVDYVATKGSVTFEPGETAKWITVFIIGQVAADPDEDVPANDPPGFIVMITEAIGAVKDMVKAYISILPLIPHIPLIPANISGKLAIYEVIISYTGYTSFHGTAEDCGIRKNGIVVLSGYLKGIENIDSDDDIMYTGDLEMIIDIDICSAKLNAKSESELCGIRVNGLGKVYTELEINFADETDRSGSRGGYIQIENKDGRFVRTVTGNCDAAEQDEEWTMVPNKSISSIFNGAELPMLLRRTLHVGQYTHTDDEGNITMVEVLRKIR